MWSFHVVAFNTFFRSKLRTVYQTRCICHLHASNSDKIDICLCNIFLYLWYGDTAEIRCGRSAGERREMSAGSLQDGG